MAETDLKGIEGYFNDYDSPNPPNTQPVRIEKSKQTSSTPKQKASGDQPTKRSQQHSPVTASKPVAGTGQTPSKVKAPQGRPPGIKSGEGEPKAKATFYIRASLMDFYREWAWDERCNVGQLVDRALSDYKRRNASRRR